MPTRDAFADGTPSWVELTTTDEESAKSFYAGLFGWEWTGEELPEGGRYWMAALKGARVAGLVALAPNLATHDPPSAWNTYVSVENVDEAVARATSAGGQVIAPPRDAGGSGRLALVQDPGGAALGMWQSGTHRGAGLVGEPGTMVWNEVFAPDTDAEVAFYGHVFGWRSESLPAPGGLVYTMFTLADSHVAGTFSPPGDPTPPHWQVWFGATDTDATAARAVELGGGVVLGPMDAPTGRMAFLRDPTGAEFAVHPAR